MPLSPKQARRMAAKARKRERRQMGQHFKNGAEAGRAFRNLVLGRLLRSGLVEAAPAWVLSSDPPRLISVSLVPAVNPQWRSQEYIDKATGALQAAEAFSVFGITSERAAAAALRSFQPSPVAREALSRLGLTTQKGES